jgi:hypothetical protein
MGPLRTAALAAIATFGCTNTQVTLPDTPPSAAQMQRADASQPNAGKTDDPVEACRETQAFLARMGLDEGIPCVDDKTSLEELMAALDPQTAAAILQIIDEAERMDVLRRLMPDGPQDVSK